jgi:hypothetical protein
LSKYEEWQIYWNFGRYNEKMDDKNEKRQIKWKNGRYLCRKRAKLNLPQVEPCLISREQAKLKKRKSGLAPTARISQAQTRDDHSKF